MKYYAGIGSRETPSFIQNDMMAFGEYFANCGYTLRSGHAIGADQAFEYGCDKVSYNKEIYIAEYADENQTPKWYDVARIHHPTFDSLSDYVKKLHARNTPIVLGRNCLPSEYSKFILCWTKLGEPIGGTGQAIRIAKTYNIPVFNMWDKNFREKLFEFLAGLK